MRKCSIQRLIRSYVFLPVLDPRQEIDGSQAEQLEFFPCGQMLQDEEEKLSPAQIRDKGTSCFSSSPSRRPC